MNAPLAKADPVARRRTFAIISHPDAGKTTLTEKLLLFGGAIQLAGEVRAKQNRRQTRSDWMGIERERGISVVTSVMTFEYDDCVFNLLDTPGHEDFSEDTYRTLTAVDAAVMVIDAAKGIEARTRKLFEVCRLRDIPIVTFVNKLDREARDPFDTLDEIEKTLALDTTPMTWPIGSGRAFCGTYDLRHNVVRKLDAAAEAEPMKVSGPNDPQIAALAGADLAAHTADEIELALGASKPFDKKAFLEGHLTPVFFGSALRNFGVRDLIDAMAELAPPPRGLDTATRHVDPREPKMTGFVFKIQANMDPNHRDRIAFLRVTSGRLTRGMKAKLIRTGKNMALNAPQFFFAQDRTIADEAYAGDVVGIPNHGALRIGDTLTEGEDLIFRGRAELRAGNPAPRPHRRRDEGEKAARGAAADGRGGRGPAVRAERRLGPDRRRGRRPPAGRSGRAAESRIRPRRRLRAEPLRDLPLGPGEGQGRNGKVPSRLSQLDFGRPGRRAGLHGDLGVQPALRAGTLARH